MPCAPPKEEEVRVGYLKQLLRATGVLYANEKPKFKKKIEKIIFVLEKSRQQRFFAFYRAFWVGTNCRDPYIYFIC